MGHKDASGRDRDLWPSLGPSALSASGRWAGRPGQAGSQRRLSLAPQQAGDSGRGLTASISTPSVGVDRCKDAPPPPPPPGMARTRGHTHTRESLKVSNNRNPSYRPGQLVVARQASPPAASPAEKCPCGPAVPPFTPAPPLTCCSTLSSGSARARLSALRPLASRHCGLSAAASARTSDLCNVPT